MSCDACRRHWWWDASGNVIDGPPFEPHWQREERTEAALEESRTAPAPAAIEDPELNEYLRQLQVENQRKAALAERAREERAALEERRKEEATRRVDLVVDGAYQDVGHVEIDRDALANAIVVLEQVLGGAERGGSNGVKWRDMTEWQLEQAAEEARIRRVAREPVAEKVADALLKHVNPWLNDVLMPYSRDQAIAILESWAPQQALAAMSLPSVQFHVEAILKGTAGGPLRRRLERAITRLVRPAGVVLGRPKKATVKPDDVGPLYEPLAEAINQLRDDHPTGEAISGVSRAGLSSMLRHFVIPAPQPGAPSWLDAVFVVGERPSRVAHEMLGARFGGASVAEIAGAIKTYRKR